MMRNAIYGHVESFSIFYSVGFGNIIYFLLRYPPFSGKTDEKIMEKVAKGTYTFDGEEWEDISKEAKEFIKKMLTIDTSFFLNL
jgi:hypothetical protein